MGSETAYFSNALASTGEVCDEVSNSLEGPPGSLRDTRDTPATERLSGLSDEELLKQIRDGAKEGLGVLFRRYARMVRAVAQRIVQDASEADDLVQEVFLFLFRKAALFDPARGSVRSWLVQVAWHRAIDRRRYLSSRHFYTSIEVEDEFLDSGVAQGVLKLYEDSMEGSLGRDTLRRIDESLSEDQRRVIRLYFFDGYTIGEIAALLGQTQGNVRNHYYRALEKMRREIFAVQAGRK